MIYKYCRRCGRRLEGEENRLRGYGRVCYEKTMAEAENRIVLVHAEHSSIQSENQKTKGHLEISQKKEKKTKGARPPHLEKTLTPTCKKPLLFMPHTPPPPRP